MKKIVCIVLLLCLCLSACGSKDGVTLMLKNIPDFASPLETALFALLDGDGDEYLKAFPPEMVEDYEEQDVYLYYYNQQDITAWLANNLRIYGETYGGNLFIEGSISSYEKVSVKSLGDANLDYHTYMRYVTEDNTEEVQKAVFSYTVGGDDAKESKEATLYFVKQDGKWYLHSCFALFTF